MMRIEFWKLFAQQCICIGIFFSVLLLSWYLPQGANIALAVVLGLGGFIGYIVCNQKEFLDGLWLFPAVFTAAAGFTAGIYFCGLESAFFGNWKLFAGAVGLVALECLICLPEFAGAGSVLAQKIVGTAAVCSALAFSILCFCRWNAPNAVFWRQGAILFLFMFVFLLGQVAYIWQGGDVRHKMNLSFCAAFFVVLFVVLLIVTEGDAADSVGDLFAGAGDGASGGKRRKKGKAGRSFPKP